MGNTFQGSLSAEGFSFAVVVSKFNEDITFKMLDGAKKAFSDYHADCVDIAFVPGSVELPIAALKLAESGRYSAVVCIGVVVKGETDHYEHVATQAVSGIMQVSLESKIPCIMGVLTTVSMEQALDRAGGREGNKGYEAATTAVEMATLCNNIQSD